MLREKQETERVLSRVPSRYFKNNTETNSISGGYTHELGHILNIKERVRMAHREMGLWRGNEWEITK